jgi:hypothetical protein
VYSGKARKHTQRANFLVYTTECRPEIQVIKQQQMVATRQLAKVAKDVASEWPRVSTDKGLQLWSAAELDTYHDCVNSSKDMSSQSSASVIFYGRV